MTTGQLQPVQNAQAMQQFVEPKPLTVADIKRQIQTIQTVMQEVMKEGVHYGKIPGTDQQSLLKPGAEKIAATFRLAPDYHVEDLSTDDVSRYRVICRLTSPTGVFVGSGLGEASTDEQKYKWRSAVCKEEFEATDETRRRIKYGRKKGGGHYIQQQVRQEPADLANTVLKMAAKRALVAAVLTATAASDLFAQDLEDMPPEVRDEIMGEYSEGSPARSKPATGKPATGKAAPRQPAARSESQKQPDREQKEGCIRPNQASQIESKCDAKGVDMVKLLAAFNVQAIADLPADEFRSALEWIDGEAQ